jgi:bacillithiol system protein YtxJ
MGIWDNLFGTGHEERNPENQPVPWISLNRDEQLNQISLSSRMKAQIIYKHSTNCGISGMVLKRLESSLEQSGYDADYYFLDVRRYRQLSDGVAGVYGVRHESPQMLIIKNSRAMATASHGAISEMDFDPYVEKKNPGI